MRQSKVGASLGLTILIFQGFINPVALATTTKTDSSSHIGSKIEYQNDDMQQSSGELKKIVNSSTKSSISSDVSKTQHEEDEVAGITSDTQHPSISQSTSSSSIEQDKSSGKPISTSGIDVSILAPNQFQTFTEPQSGETPSLLNVAVSVSVSNAGMEGTTIELPFGFIPSKEDPTFKYFDMEEPIFSIVPPDAPSATSIIDHYEIDNQNQKLIIHLKTTTTSVETLNLKFKFNNDYMGKIPEKQIVWENLQATAYNSEHVSISKSSSLNITSMAKDGMNIASTYVTPVDSDYTDGDITTRTNFQNFYRQYSYLDTTNPEVNKLYADIPEGFSLNDDYFTQGPISYSQDNSIPEGYVRYYHIMTDDVNTFPSWEPGGDKNNASLDKWTTITPPSTLKDGDQFKIIYGMTYKKINGPVVNLTTQKEYTKKPLADWKLYFKGTNIAEYDEYARVNNDTLESVGPEMKTGYNPYSHNDTTKNIGLNNIENTSFKLYQYGNGSEKVNYNKVTLKVGRESTSVPLGSYRAELIVKNALTGDTRTVDGGNGKGFEIKLPTLNNNEYINDIVVIPMGEDGKTEGEFLSKNAFWLNYSGKGWKGGKWPDGNEINTLNVSQAQTQWSLTYNDAEGKEETQKSDIGTIYYEPGKTVDAYAEAISSNAKDVLPGDTVNYTVHAYNNGKFGIADLKNTVVSVAFPKSLVLQDPTAYKSFIDRVSNTTYKDSVKVTLVSSDSSYNYYRFETTKDIKRNDKAVSFDIPLEFKVANGTNVGKYWVPFTTIASQDSPLIQVTRPVNNLPLDKAKDIGYDNTLSNPYTSYDGNTIMNVVYATKLSGQTQGRKGSDSEWTSASNIAVEKRGKPQMKARIENDGNTTFDNIRLYNILPSTSDGRGSTGNIEFTKLDNGNSDTTTYYTTKPISELPSYDESNLQTWDDATLATYGFTTTAPSDMSTVSAVYIDFGPNNIVPNGALETVLNFQVPESDNQKAINLFKYSAREVGSGTELNAESNSVIFSTEVGQVSYDQNLPKVLPEGVINASNIPESQSILLDENGEGKIILSDLNPTLSGYNFKNWEDTSNNNKIYHPGDTISFAKNSSSISINLKAVWEAKAIKVSYDANGGDLPKTQSIDYMFGDSIHLKDIEQPKRDGFRFEGWASSSEATKVDLEDNKVINFVNDTTYFAVWKATDYTVHFDSNTGEGSMDDVSMTYDKEAVLPTNGFTKAGYTFQGWATSKDGEVVYKDQATVKNLTSSDKVTLFAVWKATEANSVPEQKKNGNNKSQNSTNGRPLNNSAGKSSVKNDLPKTGESSSIYLVISGILISVMGIFIKLYKEKYRKNDK